MRFLVDAQLPPALARILSAKGFEAEHVFDVALGTANDSAVWQHAIAIQAVIITKDEDFASMVNLRSTGPAIVWVRIGNTSKRALFAWFEPLIPSIVLALERGEKLVEIV